MNKKIKIDINAVQQDTSETLDSRYEFRLSNQKKKDIIELCKAHDTNLSEFLRFHIDEALAAANKAEKEG